jgi:hypothetical protein
MMLHSVITPNMIPMASCRVSASLIMRELSTKSKFGSIRAVLTKNPARVKPSPCTIVLQNNFQWVGKE